jgi:phosphopantothenoylcysteine synthetase/decarboxylase
MNLLITAGNTLVPIDRVRCITNIFTGRTGTRIALHAWERGHAVTLLTSHPEVVALLHGIAPPADRWTVAPYRTYDELQEGMETALREKPPDVLIHCAAVSDYRAAGIYAPALGTRFQPERHLWESSDGGAPTLMDMTAAKVKSDAPELWLRLERTPKLVDRVRIDWAFRGVLVKFKLEAGVSDDRLLEIAERSRRHSAADLMVANTLEGAQEWAYLGPLAGSYERISRDELPGRLLSAVEALHQERGDG